MTMGKRIKELRLARKLTLQKVGDVWGITRASVAGWESDSSRPDQDKLHTLARLLGTTVDYLLTGATTSPRKADINVGPGPDLARFKPVPLISWVQAGAWGEVIDNLAPGDFEELLICPRAHGLHTFALRVRGVSMEPKYFDGEIIFVDPDVPADHGRNVVVRMESEKESTFKQLVIEDGRKFLKALNPSWEPQFMEINGNATICGVVIGKWVPE